MVQTLRGLRHVVIVDDSKLMLATLSGIIGDVPDVVVRSFISSSEALAWSTFGEVDCFVLDYHMPEPDGLEMTRRIRADERLAEVPIVIVTGESDRELRTNVLLAGANDYITQPVHRLELIARLTTLLSLHDARQALKLHVGQLQSSLVDSEQRARAQAARLEALWRVANDPNLRTDERIDAMLRHAAVAIRPTGTFYGLLSRIDGDELVLLAVGVPADDQGPRATVLKVGNRAKIAGTLAARVARTEAWNELNTLDGAPPTVKALGWRSAISTLFSAGASRYTMLFASHEPVTEPFGSDDYAYVELLAAFFANQLEVDALERSLRDSEERSRQHAQRLEALSRIINNPVLQNEELWNTLVREAASALRPGQPFGGMVARVDDGEFVIEVVSEPPESSPSDGPPMTVGRRVPVAGTLIERAIGEGKATQSWDEIRGDGPAQQRARARNWRSFICTTFDGGGSRYVLAFSSTVPTTKPFGSQEHAYVEVLASFFANQLQQRWQFDRIQYQQAHDVLTGLLNRSQFRSRARMACMQAEADVCAVIVVDVSGFRKINETYGHMIGDALLVEVATALRSRVDESEIVGRLGDDVFGICLPRVSSKADARRRALDVEKIFEQPFSTGDREGKEFISLSGCVEFAAAPEDGEGFDAILARADAALALAKQRRK